jgi:hypothetical protein
MSLAGAAAPMLASSSAFAVQCVTGGLPGFLPNALTVDCASKRNFQSFRKNPDYLGLAGVVSMTTVKGSQGTYPAGNLFLFPWVTSQGKKTGKTWPAVLPINGTQIANSTAIPGPSFPVDEYFLRYILRAPWTSFIGFQVGKPYPAWLNRQADWFTNVSKLADGGAVGIDWTSSNLNNPWFGGSHWIPSTEACSGKEWRALIVAGLTHASLPAVC